MQLHLEREAAPRLHPPPLIRGTAPGTSPRWGSQGRYSWRTRGVPVQPAAPSTSSSGRWLDPAFLPWCPAGVAERYQQPRLARLHLQQVYGVYSPGAELGDFKRGQAPPLIPRPWEDRLLTDRSSSG